MDPIEIVRRELARYEHALCEFSAAEGTGGVELVIGLKTPIEGAHVYHAPIHPRDLEHPQFPWTFQRYLYDCLHDYMVELFLRTPQQREHRA